MSEAITDFAANDSEWTMELEQQDEAWNLSHDPAPPSAYEKLHHAHAERSKWIRTNQLSEWPCPAHIMSSVVEAEHEILILNVATKIPSPCNGRHPLAELVAAYVGVGQLAPHPRRQHACSSPF